MKILKLDEKKYKKAISKSTAFLKKGETVVIPTDTIYGLACDALNEKAVEKLYQIKERDRQKGLPIFVNSIEMARRLAYIDKKKEAFLNKIWPGPITVVVHAKDAIPRIAIGNRETVALRLPDYKFITDLITAFGKPVTGTSANISGNEPIRSAIEAREQWKRETTKPVLIINAGEIKNTEPSTIVDITGPSPIILRSGIITKKEFDEFFKKSYG